MTRRTAKRSSMPQIDPDAIPPKVTDDLVLRDVFDERTGKQIPGRAALRRESAWQRVLRLKQHIDGSNGGETSRSLDRRDAGNAFVTAWLTRQKGTKDSLDKDGGGNPNALVGLTDAQIDAGRRLRGWECHCGPADWLLLRRVCGEGYSPAQAVKELNHGYRNEVLARFREALDGLVEAQRLSHRCDWCRRHLTHGIKLND